MNSYVSTKREYMHEYLKNLTKLYEEPIIYHSEVVGQRIFCEDKGKLVQVECYFKLNHLYIVRSDDPSYVPKKGLVKVSNLYDRENVLRGEIQVPNFTLEGTDGIGKSTTIESLINEGIVCFDRNLDTICKYMLFDVPMERRIEEYKKFLKDTKDRIVFLVNMDEEEIRRRIYSRDVVTEFDKYAVEYNRMYYDTYQEMARRGYLYDKLFLSDCTGLSIEEQNEQIKRLVLR